ncbi:MAG: Holliday junction branch migration protein RuvA [Defluviitaleaceae bacterium]|nr:Holliday junction branch migration protein RuvA [Defluviitaleaceae bacterium]
MIAYIKGSLAYIQDQTAIIDVGGVGYLIHVSASTLSRLPPRQGEVQLFTYMQTSENGQSLHGFLTQEELRLFTLLISVSGIGPRVASAILSTLSPSQLIIAIVADDVAALSKAQGVGKKTAQRVLLELRDKIKTTDTWDNAGKEMQPFQNLGSPDTSEKQDAIDALLALGYGRTEAMQTVLEIAEENMTADQIIKQSLKKLSK